MVDAPTPGTGKGLLAQAIVLVSTGAYPGVVSEKDDNEELRKTITALLLEGASAVLIDNVTRKLGQVSLAALLTARTWRDRLLGRSKTVEVPNRTLWIVTGNNVAMNDEMARRSVRIRLDAGVEEPWHRQGFRHDPLLEWADEHRGELVWAALVLVANWLARGAEPFTERTLGSFEPWARVVGGVLRDAGIEGFLQGRQRMHSEADRDSASWATFFEAWWREYGDRPMTAGELMPSAEERAAGKLWETDQTDLGRRGLVSRSGASAAASSWAVGFRKSMLPTIIPAHGLHGASCPLLQRHAVKTSNVWTSGHRP